MSARAKPARRPRASRGRGWRDGGGAGPKLLRNIGALLELSPAERAKLLAALSDKQCDELFYDWSLWARDDQRPPPGDWIYWLILAGRGAGKTRAGAEAVREWVEELRHRQPDRRNPRRRARRDGAGRIRTDGGLPARRAAALRARGRPPRLAERRGVAALLGRGAGPAAREAAREIVARRARRVAPPDAFEQALLGLRLGAKPQAVVTTTPRPTKLIKQLVADPLTIVSRGSTFDNIHHLAQAFVERITQRYAGRTIGRQELFAEIVEETPGALWTRALIERQRLAPGGAPASYVEIVIGVDPPAKSGAKADECGIVVAARAEGRLIHVLADLSSQGDTPGRWAARVVSAFRRFAANRIVAEINNGGEMVEAVLRQSDANLPVRNVTATRGKYLRAEPIAAAYERGIVFHLGAFEKLEDQLCALTPDFDSRAAGFSPDRADALVWAVADLLGVSSGASAMMAFYAQGAD